MLFEEAALGSLPPAELVYLVWGLVALMIIALILTIAGWVWMLIDCTRRRRFNHANKAIWFIILVVGGPFAMLPYFLLEMRKGMKMAGERGIQGRHGRMKK